MQMPPKRQFSTTFGRRSGKGLTAAPPLVLLLVAAPIVAGAQTATPPVTAATVPARPAVTVTVDGQPVAFEGQGPVVDTSGSVLVPLRGVFEKLGAVVQYAGQTKTVTAIKGETTVSLRLGDSSAFVNGAAHPLSVPPRMLNGATMVPLRFVSEALGAIVKWDTTTQAADITTPKPLDTSPVIGTVTAIDAGARTLTVHPAVGDKDIPLTLIPDAPLLIKTGDTPAVVAPDLTTIKIGDQVTVKRNEAGLGFSLEADYDDRRGVVKSVDAMPATGNPKITFADDTSAEIAVGSPVQRGTDTIALGDIVPGQKAILRVNPVTHVASSVSVEIPKVDAASITQSAGSRMLKAGDEVTVTLIGTPGAKAIFNVPGIAPLTGQPLTESTETAGTYNGTFKVPGGVTLENASISGSLTMAGVTSPTVQATANLNIDSTGPTFSDLTPAMSSNGTGLRPRITGSYADTGSGVDPTGTRLFVNGKDVTAQTTIEKGFFAYNPPSDLPPGDTTATIVARDVAGNESRQDWTFTLSPMINPIHVVTLVGISDDHPLGADEVLKVRAEADPGGSARFSVGKNGVIAGPMVEQTPGVYVGSYTVRRGDSLTREPVTAYFTPAGGDKESSLPAIQTVTIRAGAPRPPIIDLPADGTVLGTSFVILSGRGTKSSTVRIDIRYNGTFLLFNMKGGGTVQTVDITVDGDGNWKSDPITLSADSDLKGVTFTAEVVTIAGNGDKSEPATVTFKR